MHLEVIIACIVGALATSVGIAIKSYKRAPQPVATRTIEHPSQTPAKQQNTVINLKYLKPIIEEVRESKEQNN